jgi:hypothetical protein
MPLTDSRRAFTPYLSLFVLLVCVKPCAVLANTAPTISGTPPTTAAAGYKYYFKPVAKDADGDVLKFSIVNKPGWLSFSAQTGTLAGTPSSQLIGRVYPGIRIWVSDGTASRSLPYFSITVTKASNSAPKISGTPPTTAVVNQSYSFTPTASDPNGDTLQFTIKNKPGWAGFSSSTGRLSGSPSSSSVGTFSNIVITASDGKASTSLPSFSIAVKSSTASTADGSVTLSWIAPTRNTDGTTITNLSGYRVYYGQSSGSYSRTLSLPNASLTSVGLENLAAGTWYFAVKAVATSGEESTFSQQVSKYVQ